MARNVHFCPVLNIQVYCFKSLINAASQIMQVSLTQWYRQLRNDLFWKN